MGPNIADVLEEVDAGTAAAIRVKLPKLRYQMWHGKWAAAIERMRGLRMLATPRKRLHTMHP
jgi:hypothetical protein